MGSHAILTKSKIAILCSGLMLWAKKPICSKASLSPCSSSFTTDEKAWR
ncbi:hypothetical protein D030_3562 [Vibrio parahaemolyticus AQ3810]|nr:hypothetical protein D030_3562 [Vibrio parahaemolyticus AQ3810]